MEISWEFRLLDLGFLVDHHHLEVELLHEVEILSLIFLSWLKYIYMEWGFDFYFFLLISFRNIVDS
jgi:hypothetical protein